MLKIIPFLILLILSQIGWAADNKMPFDTKESRTLPFVAEDMVLKEEVCPLLETLVRDPKEQSWKAPGGWKTTSPSFASKLGSFVGAQWVGVSVGEIICIYVEAGRGSFPVTLQRGRLVPAPTDTKAWSTDKGGYMECKSNKVEDCDFLVQERKPVTSVYDHLDFKKEKKNESNP